MFSHKKLLNIVSINVTNILLVTMSYKNTHGSNYGLRNFICK
ncbi:hypothetical protein HMPREF1581_00482 [Gardnerella vaginalis JCP8108]|uniref:Uncharacterized protein n=1 Tax=Gardnerella vaginalis JCP8108 TaxID=1261066 RepID=S4I442_GARVA|nr:hypothetical protein HMPREF1581_00482 [Gardnerella vaginalis JCP8108]